VNNTFTVFSLFPPLLFDIIMFKMIQRLQFSKCTTIYYFQDIFVCLHPFVYLHLFVHLKGFRCSHYQSWIFREKANTLTIF